MIYIYLSLFLFIPPLLEFVISLWIKSLSHNQTSCFVFLLFEPLKPVKMYFRHLMTGYESAPISGPLVVIQPREQNMGESTTTPCSALRERMLEMLWVQSKPLNLRLPTTHFCTLGEVKCSIDTLDSSGTSVQLRDYLYCFFNYCSLISPFPF